jgi:ComF family protein
VIRKGAASCSEALKDLLFPPRCLGCERRLESSRPPLFCADCHQALRFLDSPLCTRCGLPFPAGVDHLCGDCLAGRPAFALARSLFAYQPPVPALILALKFAGQLTGLASLGALAARSPLLPHFTEPDLVLPVPLHPARLRERGFNQALLIARACFPHWRPRLDTALLLRRRSTRPQAQLSGRERRANLTGVFALAEPERVRDRRVLLVDDVFTTGSTVQECSRVLAAAGAGRIEVFTLARSFAR